jgi:hypothetical protein
MRKEHRSEQCRECGHGAQRFVSTTTKEFLTLFHRQVFANPRAVKELSQCYYKEVIYLLTPEAGIPCRGYQCQLPLLTRARCHRSGLRTCLVKCYTKHKGCVYAKRRTKRSAIRVEEVGFDGVKAV